MSGSAPPSSSSLTAESWHVAVPQLSIAWYERRGGAATTTWDSLLEGLPLHACHGLGTAACPARLADRFTNVAVRPSSLSQEIHVHKSRSVHGTKDSSSQPRRGHGESSRSFVTHGSRHT